MAYVEPLCGAHWSVLLAFAKYKQENIFISAGPIISLKLNAKPIFLIDITVENKTGFQELLSITWKLDLSFCLICSF